VLRENLMAEDMKQCLVCKGTRHRVLCRKQEQNYLRCLDCRHVFVEHVVDQAQVRRLYQKRTSHHGSEEKLKWDYSEIKRELVYQPLLSRLSRYSSSGRLLDIGCSNGSFIKSAQQDGWDVCGIELETSSYEIAKTHELSVYNNDLLSMEFPENFFQVVTMWQVIEHLEDPQTILREIYRILVPGGVFALSTPNIDSIGWLLLKGKWGAVEPGVHPHLFTTKGLCKIVVTCGFSICFLQTLDIKPATVKGYLQRLKGQEEPDGKQARSVARLANLQSERKMRGMLRLRHLANIPLRVLRLGEDIYAIFRKEKAISEC
jgi:SAM-dependent methyltransferase